MRDSRNVEITWTVDETPHHSHAPAELPGLPSYRLQKLADHFEIPAPIVHRAHGDVEITFNLWLKLVALLEQKGITTLEKLLAF